MKKIIFLSLPIYLAIACNQDNHPFENQTEQTNLQNMVLNRASSNDICEQLITEYRSSALTNPPITLQQKIDLLDSIAFQNNSFLELQTFDYTKITAVEASVFLINSDSAVNSLIVSKEIATYLNIILGTNYSPSKLRGDIRMDLSLSQIEKNTLYFILDRNTTTLDHHDPSWDKKNIVGITKGYTQNEAQAIFNAALISIYNQ